MIDIFRSDCLLQVRRIKFHSLFRRSAWWRFRDVVDWMIFSADSPRVGGVECLNQAGVKLRVGHVVDGAVVFECSKLT